MTDKINLNADIGEGFGAYDIGCLLYTSDAADE